MNLEEEIFKRRTFIPQKLIFYGFLKNGDEYLYSKKILNDSLEVKIIIGSNEKIKGQVFDLNVNEEYTVYRLEDNLGKFASLVKENFINILNNIKDECTQENYFLFAQSNRIASRIIEKYSCYPEFLWKSYPLYGIFRNSKNNKWFGIIMNIDMEKISSEKGLKEIINVKLDEEKVQELLKKKGFYLAYHMNKTKWISIVLDDTLDDDEIMEYVDLSFASTNIAEEWIIPANPKYYDINKAFLENDVIMWHQTPNMQINDVVYIYVTAPYQAIMYKCVIQKLNLNCDWDERPQMELKLKEKYKEDKYNKEWLEKRGIKSVRGARRASKDLIGKM